MVHEAVFKAETQRLLAEHLSVPVSEVAIEPIDGTGLSDLLLTAEKHTFVAELKSTGAAGATAVAIERAQASARQLAAIPLVVVPFMGAVGAERCRAANVSWMDLSGNADITAPGIRVHIEGRPNKFKRRGRRENVFAPMSSRIARWLLAHPTSAFTQGELAAKCHLDQGFTSRIVRRLEVDGLVERFQRLVRVRDADLLLDAWKEKYDFARHHVIRGHVAARSSDELVASLAKGFKSEKLKHALTGLAAAWRMDAFAEFRLVSFYLAEPPSKALLDNIGFREEPRGANVWLVVPNDEGVFDHGSYHSGVFCAHPVQVYLDLFGHPERSKDAADHLRSTHLKWGKAA